MRDCRYCQHKGLRITKYGEYSWCLKNGCSVTSPKNTCYGIGDVMEDKPEAGNPETKYYGIYYRIKGSDNRYGRVGHFVEADKGEFKGTEVFSPYKFTKDEVSIFKLVYGEQYKLKVMTTISGDLYDGEWQGYEG